MRILSRYFFVLLAGLSLTLPAASAAQNKDKDDDVRSDRVAIPTFDGMELGGTYYPAMGKADKDAVVMCLHDFTHRKGGGSHGEWDNLAAKLQKDGYAVLTFDFRGFGNSKSVSPEFWKYRHNQTLRGFRGGVKSAESIDQKDFPLGYYLNLINDIVAARAFLDRKNDGRQLNTSNLIVVGAGQAASLGALWMAAEMHRQKDLTPPDPLGRFVIPKLDDPEGRDIAAAVWLTISPTIEGRAISTPLKSALEEVARENKVPTVFVYGGSDKAADRLAINYLDAMRTAKGVKYELKNTGSKAIVGTELSGSALLGEKLATTGFLLKYLNTVLEDRGSKEWRKREEDKARYFWTVKGRMLTPAAKMPGAKICNPVPLSLLKLER